MIAEQKCQNPGPACDQSNLKGHARERAHPWYDFSRAFAKLVEIEAKIMQLWHGCRFLIYSRPPELCNRLSVT